MVVSTTGQGDLPTNSRRFWRSLLKKRLPPNLLEGVNITTFGLGDSSYPRYILLSYQVHAYTKYSRFNWAIRKIHKRLTQLGAEEKFDRGEADEQHEEGYVAILGTET